MTGNNENIISFPKMKYYEIFIDEPISEEKKNYRKIYSLIKNAKSDETLKFIINTEGGDMMTAMQICNALDLCNAKTIAEIHEASSGGAFIAFHCKKIITMSNCQMMIHTASYGSYKRKHNNIKQRVENEERLIKDFIDSTFNEFLSKDELKEIYEGQDLYFSPKEINKRLNYETN